MSNNEMPTYSELIDILAPGFPQPSLTADNGKTKTWTFDVPEHKCNLASPVQAHVFRSEGSPCECGALVLAM